MKFLKKLSDNIFVFFAFLLAGLVCLIPVAYISVFLLIVWAVVHFVRKFW